MGMPIRRQSLCRARNPQRQWSAAILMSLKSMLQRPQYRMLGTFGEMCEAEQPPLAVVDIIVFDSPTAAALAVNLFHASHATLFPVVICESWRRQVWVWPEHRLPHLLLLLIADATTSSWRHCANVFFCLFAPR